MPKAFGLVETRGLVAAIEAADAMVKTSNITLVGKERTDPAMITIKIVGDVAAVKSAVEAGAKAASLVGEVIAIHIIPQPDEQLTVLFPELGDKQIPAKEPVYKKEQKPVAEVPQKKSEEKASEVVKKELKEKTDLFEDSNDTIARLRREALNIKDAQKEETQKEKIKPQQDVPDEEIENLNVHKLRRLARSTEGFPIQGRQISRANRTELLEHFKKLKK